MLKPGHKKLKKVDNVKIGNLKRRIGIIRKHPNKIKTK